MIELYFACAKTGAIFVPLNFRAKADELSYMINHSQAKVLFLGARYVDMVRSINAELNSVAHFVCFDAKIDGMLSYESLIAEGSENEPVFEIGDEDVTVLMYTSGTTGRPKAVPLRHDAFVNYILNNVEPASPENDEVNLLTVPLYHVAGMQGMLAAIYGGRTLVIMRQFDAVKWMETVQKERVNRAMLVPTMLKRVIDHPDFNRYDLSSLQVITYGAAPMPFEVINKAIRLMPWVKFINAYGQTETASTITFLGPEDHIIEGTDEEKEKKLRRLASSIGKPLPDVEIKIVDEQGKELPPYETGDIIVRGARVMKGYWGDEDKTKRAFTSDGWLITGDRGWRDEDGYIYLSGRADDVIIRGGENISPEEVENVLLSHPKVEDAAVIGVADPEWGQQPKAIVVLKNGETATEDEIIDFCRSRLAGFKRPRSVVFVESLPRNPMGKVIRKALREQYG
jgi:acyl-CoA synthetase (AMP-forming)/AMP-acid ligase II